MAGTKKAQPKKKRNAKAKAKNKPARAKPASRAAARGAKPKGGKAGLAPRPARPAVKPQAGKPGSKPTAAEFHTLAGFQVLGTNDKALFTLKLHRGEGMTLIAMNWKSRQPPKDFVGFAIEYREPGGNAFFPLKNRLGFLDAQGNVDPNALSTLQSPIQKFRWVHFPRNADLAGDFLYRVTPMFMDAVDKLTAGEAQSVAIQLARETYPGLANVTFTRGFVSSQAFVDHYVKDGPVETLVAPKAAQGLNFKPTHPDTVAALAWMGFEARAAILEVLDQAIADKAEVRVIAYDCNLPEIVDRLEQLGSALKVIIDDSKGHGGQGTAETEAERRLVASAGRANVLRQHMGDLQHNKTITVNGPTVKKVVCGSTNLSWRGLFMAAFDSYFPKAAAKNNDVAGFGGKPSAQWVDLGLPGIDAQVSFSPHAAQNAKLEEIANDIKDHATSSLLYSLAFLYETGGAVRDAIEAVTADKDIFVYGISDRHVGGGLDVQDPSGNVAPVFAAELSENVPEPFKSEPSGGTGTRIGSGLSGLVQFFDAGGSQKR